MLCQKLRYCGKLKVLKMWKIILRKNFYLPRQAPSIRLEHHHHLRRPLEFRRRAVNLRHRRQVQRSHEAGLGPRSLTRHVDQPSLLHHSPRLHLPGYFLRYLQNFPPSNCQLWRPFGEIRCSVVLSWRPNLNNRSLRVF